jgi:preprotein translocase subunit SecY
MSRLTFAGASFLTLLYLLPNLISSQMGISQTAAQFFGGTSLLILVGVVLDVMKQMETHLLQANYDGFLRASKATKYDRMQGTGNAADGKTIAILWTVIGVIVIAGVIYYRVLN